MNVTLNVTLAEHDCLPGRTFRGISGVPARRAAALNECRCVDMNVTLWRSRRVGMEKAPPG